MRLRAIGIAITTLLAATTGTPAATALPDPNSSMPYGFSPVGDDAVYVHAIMHRMEERIGGGGDFRWDGEAWVGTDFNKLWLKSEGSLQGGAVADGRHEVLYDRPVTTYFDLQAGLRADLDSLPGRTWAAFGIQGLAPYSFEVSATAYASDGRALRGDARRALRSADHAAPDPAAADRVEFLYEGRSRTRGWAGFEPPGFRPAAAV